jgi:hypothetical protein
MLSRIQPGKPDRRLGSPRHFDAVDEDGDVPGSGFVRSAHSLGIKLEILELEFEFNGVCGLCASCARGSDGYRRRFALCAGSRAPEHTGRTDCG